jgi:hypothetical protein
VLIGQIPASSSQEITPYGIYLPAIFRQLPSPSEVEPNNTRAEATGPLAFGVSYFGIQDDASDQYDIYYFEVTGPQTIRITLTNPPRGDMQLQLHSSTTVLPLRYVYQAPYVIDYPVTISGKYYVVIYFPDGTPSLQIYQLSVSNP